MCERGGGERESERRGNKRGGGGGVWTSLVTGPTGTPIVLRSHHFLEVRTKEKRGDRKKGPGSKCRDGAPDFAAAGRGCLDSKALREKRRRSRL